MSSILHHSVKLPCSAENAFEMFTVNDHLQNWLTVVADVEPREGGKYELFWDPKDLENNSTKGCKITALQSGVFVSFQWKGPTQYKHFMNNDPLTHVVVFFIPVDDETDVHLIHSGWASSSEWEEARTWFKQAWGSAFKRLEDYVRERNVTTTRS